MQISYMGITFNVVPISWTVCPVFSEDGVHLWDHHTVELAKV